MSFGHPILNPPFFPSSSVPLPTFLGPVRGTKFAKQTLGKRRRPHQSSPRLEEEQRTKQRRGPPGNGLEHSSATSPSAPEPWHQNDRFVRRLNEAELQCVVKPNATFKAHMTRYPFGDDDNCPIHPLFISLTQLTLEILPALRLATRLLLSPCSLTFFHTLIASPLTLLLPESQYYNVPLFHLSSSSDGCNLPSTENFLTEQALLSLTNHISLQISPDKRLATRWAYTERLLPPCHPTTGLAATTYAHLPYLFPTPAHLHTNAQLIPPTLSQQALLVLNFRGTNALINLSPCFLRVLHAHTLPTPSPAQKLRCAFMLAVTLVHELAHAVYMCRVPAPPIIPITEPNPATTTQPQAFAPTLTGNPPPWPRPQHPLPHLPIPNPNPQTTPTPTEYEPFYSTHRLSELGHAWETAVFSGGKVLALAQDAAFRLGLAWQRWPAVDDHYVSDAAGRTVPLTRVGTGAPKWETVYVLADAWLWRWFLRGAWDGSRGGGGGMGVAGVEKGLGVRVRNYDFVAEAKGDDGWASDCSSRGRGADAEGVVRPGQFWVESSDEDGDDEDDEDTEDEDD